MPMAAAIFDREMRHLAYNAAWATAHGHPQGESLLGKSYYETNPEIRERWRAIHARCLAGATERADLDECVHPDGRRAYLRWVIAPWRDDGGAIGGIFVSAEDVSDQVATRKRLEERESLIRAFFEKSPVGLNLCRMDGLWLESNPAFLRIIGYTREEADGGLTYWQLTPRKYDADENRQLELLREVKHYGPYEKEFIRKDGTLVPVRLNGFIVERDGEEYIWSLIEDMTEQRALEAKLEEERVRAIQASKLATMGEMAASFAHEINNPLGIISAFSHVLADAVAKGRTKEAEEAIDAIHSATDRAAKIVRGLRRFARESVREPRARLSVASLIEDALVLCRARIDTHGVSLTVDKDTTAEIEGHAIELSQVLVNLLNNAFDATRGSRNGWIRVSVKDDPAGCVAVVVEDSGAGIPEHARDAIFRSFFTTKKSGEGTGLGLSISRSIVERHGGTLTLDTTAPNTRFVVRLPRVQS